MTTHSFFMFMNILPDKESRAFRNFALGYLITISTSKQLDEVIKNWKQMKQNIEDEDTYAYA